MAPNQTTVKFLCSYGGRIIPRYPDGKLRYNGGDTRVLSVSRSISFNELASKISEICGMAVSTLRCQLPTDDLDALVTVTSDEDLTNLMEEYDISSMSPVKIRAFVAFLTPFSSKDLFKGSIPTAFLTPLKSKTTTTTTSSPPLSTASSTSSKSRSRSPPSPSTRETCPTCVERSMRNYVHRSPSHNQFYLINN